MDEGFPIEGFKLADLAKEASLGSELMQWRRRFHDVDEKCRELLVQCERLERENAELKEQNRWLLDQLPATKPNSPEASDQDNEQEEGETFLQLRRQEGLPYVPAAKRSKNE